MIWEAYQEYSLRVMVEEDLLRVLSWRNTPDVRRFMYTKHEISIKEHSDWFSRINSDPSRHALIFEIDGIPSGFVNIHENLPGGVASWGFYVSPESARGTGHKLGVTTIDYAFNELGLHKLNAEALGYNSKSIRFHEKLGFKKEGTLRNQHYDGQCYHDVLCFGLLLADWELYK